MSALVLTPRQLWEASRLADRCGDALLQDLDGGRLLVLLSTGAQNEPDLALELGPDGEILARQFLSLRHQDAEDPCADFSEEEELPDAVDLSHARPAPRCSCPHPRHDGSGETCSICGHGLAVEAVGVPEAV